MPLTDAALITVEITVIHAEAISFEFVIVVYVTTLIFCPTEIGDWHSPGLPSDKTDEKE
jgi:hypothetical protein